MNNRKILKLINSLDVKKTKKLFNTYLDKTKENISNANTSLEVMQHASNLNIVLNRDINKFIN